MALDFEGLCRFGAESGASDIFLKEGTAPALKINSAVRKLDHPALTKADLEPVVRGMMTADKFEEFQLAPDHDVSYNIPEVARFRVNIYKTKGGYAMCLRVVNLRIRQFSELGLPDVLADFTRHANGLVLVTGATGSGKSTTLAAMIDLVNQERRAHLVTIEDPIEYVHPDKNCIVSQREIGMDTKNFGAALRAALREAPDVILVGELRDTETMAICLQAAETGHLVFSTLHTPSAAESMERMLSMFQPHEKALVQVRLSKTLRGIIAQKLVPTVDGKGRACALEILNVSPTVAQYIEEGRTGQIYQAIKEGADQWKMQTLNMALERYYREGKIDEEHALEYANLRSELRQMLRRADAMMAGEAG